ncbi:MAG: hypothetical protein QOI41_5767 [Myxococcales bacterium]|nr:hypothetical protein [Myxococcales bacterium]
MGAWGPGSFENDSALDWFGDLEDGGVELLRETLEHAADADDDEYLEVDEASAALAAAEIVAAARGKGDERLDDDAVEWTAGSRRDITDADLALARRAVVRVIAKSEVQELWDEGGTNNEWRPVVGELLRRLS